MTYSNGPNKVEKSMKDFFIHSYHTHIHSTHAQFIDETQINLYGLAIDD